jgi:hypothetical protein
MANGHASRSQPPRFASALGDSPERERRKENVCVLVRRGDRPVEAEGQGRRQRDGSEQNQGRQQGSHGPESTTSNGAKHCQDAAGRQDASGEQRQAGTDPG